jgi:hypothetical protein
MKIWQRLRKYCPGKILPWPKLFKVLHCQNLVSIRIDFGRPRLDLDDLKFHTIWAWIRPCPGKPFDWLCFASAKRFIPRLFPSTGLCTSAGFYIGFKMSRWSWFRIFGNKSQKFFRWCLFIQWHQIVAPWWYSHRCNVNVNLSNSVGLPCLSSPKAKFDGWVSE